MLPDTSRIAPTPSGAASAVRDAGDGRAAALLAELTPAFDTTFQDLSHIALAVSGGSDSTALMHLVAAWRHARLERTASVMRVPPPPTVSVLTINHALRADSALEAAAVARAAAHLGLPHTTLHWDGPKPHTGVQAAAREARFSLIVGHLTANGWPAVVMAHTADDQAETLLMRLARGSGIDGLAAMRLAGPLVSGHTLLRPLLGVQKAALTTYLVANGICWSEDPGNSSPVFERVRVRQFRASATAAGLGLESVALARSATRAARASDALNTLTAQFWRHRGDRAEFDPLGSATLDWDWLLEQPAELRLRVMAGLIDVIGGRHRPVSLGRLEALTIGCDWRLSQGFTLHGVLVTRLGASRIRLTRETGRHPLPEHFVQPGQTTLWDGRFQLSLSSDSAAPLHVGALTSEGYHLLKSADWRPDKPVSAQVAWTQPALRDAQGLVSAPTLGFARAGFTSKVHCRAILPWFCRQDLSKTGDLPQDG